MSRGVFCFLGRDGWSSRPLTFLRLRPADDSGPYRAR